jgi:hypothetical protein
MYAAEARLNEVRIEPGTGDHPLVAGAAVELAAELCAYGMLADEVDHMRARAPHGPADKQPTRENGHGGKAYKAPFPDMAVE